jgi:hypothetical protein
MSSQLLRQDLIPIGTGYLILMAVLAAGLRLLRRGRGEQPEPTEAGHAGSSGATSGGAGSGGAGSGGKAPSRVARRVRPGWPRFAVQVGGTVLGGYLVLLAVDVGYYYGVAKVAGQFLDSAFTGTALLLAVSLPLFAIRSWLAERRQDQGRR